MTESRFKDTGQTASDFLNNVLVECPRCKCCAKVVSTNSEERPTMICNNCGVFYYSSIVHRGNYDEYCELPLWLRVDCCGNTLWAYNEEHLNFLEDYVSALIRERIPNLNSSVASRLPAWVKSAKNRKAVLKCIQKLRKKLLALS